MVSAIKAGHILFKSVFPRNLGSYKHTVNSVNAKKWVEEETSKDLLTWTESRGGMSSDYRMFRVWKLGKNTSISYSISNGQPQNIHYKDWTVVLIYLGRHTHTHTKRW